MSQEHEDDGDMRRISIAEIVAPADEREWEREYKALKAEFLALQEDTIALAAEYSAACNELRYEKECQEELVQQWAEIRVRRMREFLRVPKNPLMLFMEERRPAMRQRYPLVSRRELRLKLEDEWELLTDKEKAEWTQRFARFKTTTIKRPAPVKTPRKTSVTKSTTKAVATTSKKPKPTTPSTSSAASTASTSNATSTPAPLKSVLKQRKGATETKEKAVRKPAAPKRKLSADSGGVVTPKTTPKKRNTKTKASDSASVVPPPASDAEPSTPVSTPRKRKKSDDATPKAAKQRTPPRPKGDTTKEKPRKAPTPKSRTPTPTKAKKPKTKREPGGRQTPKAKAARGAKRRLDTSEEDDDNDARHGADDDDDEMM
ncbi:hypothetical protein PINS_up009537 [Pythium insidiosum]|nr:hypothetical protein PINS_up009537 [Pythium insidiosum]